MGSKVQRIRIPPTNKLTTNIGRIENNKRKKGKKYLHPAPRRCRALLRLLPRPDRPEHRQRRRGTGGRILGRLEANRAERQRESEVKREHERGGERDGGEEVEEERARDEEVEIEERDREQEQRALAPHAPQHAERGALRGDGDGEEGGILGLENMLLFGERRGGGSLRRGVVLLWWEGGGYVDFDLGVELLVAVVGVFLELRIEIGRDAYAFFPDLNL